MDRQGAARYIGRWMNFELRTDAGPRRQARPQPASRSGWGRLPVGAWLLLAALALAVPTLLPAAPALAQQGLHAPEDIATSRDRVLSDSRYQTEMPEPQSAPPVDEPLTLPPWLVEAILWTFGAAVAALILFFLFNLARELLEGRHTLKSNREPPAAETAKVESVPPAQRAAEQRTLAEADALAAAGRFSEAIHLLLLVAMERLRRELGPRVAPAMTGREVLRLAPLPGAVVDPLTRMVALSEINHFGGRSAAAPDYRDCRDDFLRFSGLEEAPA